MNVPDIASPCTGVCTINSQGVCQGCARTLDEIAAWPAANVAQKQAILARIAQSTLADKARPA